MIEISPGVSLEDSEVRFDYMRASGPGGQNVNKVASAVKLYFDVRHSPSLPDEVKDRLAKLAGSRLTADGVLVIDARRYRTQEQNRLDAIRRLAALIQKALDKPKLRKKTRPTVTASAARLAEKKRRGLVKRLRHYDPADWEG
jgi:ribosome-associated protein